MNLHFIQLIILYTTFWEWLPYVTSQLVSHETVRAFNDRHYDLSASLSPVTSLSGSLINTCWLGPWGAPPCTQKAGKWNSQNNWPNLKNGLQSSKSRWNKQEIMLASYSALTQYFMNCFWNIYSSCSMGHPARVSSDSKEFCHLNAVTQERQQWYFCMLKRSRGEIVSQEAR